MKAWFKSTFLTFPKLSYEARVELAVLRVVSLRLRGTYVLPGRRLGKFAMNEVGAAIEGWYNGL